MAGHEVRQRGLISALARSTVAALVAAGVLFVGAIPNPLAPNAHADSHGGPGCQWGSCEGGPENPEPDDPGPDNPAPDWPQPGDPRTDEYLTPACSSNGPPPGDGGALCGAATQSCQAEGELRFFVYTRTERWNGSAWVPEGSWEFQGSECRGSDEEEGPQVTPELVMGWLEEYGLPSASAEVNPGNGRTLVDFDNVFYTELSGEQTVQVGPGGIVTVHANPVSYRWYWGDGTSDVTSQPGGPYPNMDVTHTYSSTGDYEVRVDVTYSGWYEFGGNRVDLPGTYTQPGEASTPVTVLSKRDVLSR
ncbi:PKD domain-containing protein [Actinopolymorpha sp. B9G3]|uniref:PKD domain-containing protein n=1 Tax=Actinopolymorpha sp. B9G3 TaxID=3158970 RepID=UPI0032D8CBE3